jgi:hypothetical protein
MRPSTLILIERIALVLEPGRRSREKQTTTFNLLPLARHRFKNRCYPLRVHYSTASDRIESSKPQR